LRPALGATLGTPETVSLGFATNKTAPQLQAVDRFCHRSVGPTDWSHSTTRAEELAAASILHSGERRSDWAFSQSTAS
jgi:hypothetical protein